MLHRLAFYITLAAVLQCAPLLAQHTDSQLPDAPQPQAQPKPPTPAPVQSPDTQPPPPIQPESKIKKKIKSAAPNCIKIGGSEHCKESKPDDDAEDQQQEPRIPANQPPPRASDANESSSKDNAIPFGEGSGPAPDVQELHSYNPHEADKQVEIGTFYFKRNNYRAAESRFEEALDYMPNHAEAIFHLAEAQEKLGKNDQARANYEKYLKILPEGAFAQPAKKALARLGTQAKDATSPPAQKSR